MAGRKTTRNSSQKQSILEYMLIRLQPYQREIGGALLLLIASMTLFAVFGIVKNSWSDWWAELARLWFGWGVIPTMLVVIWFGFLLVYGRFKDEYRAIPIDRVIAIEILLLAGLGVIHLIGSLWLGLGILQLADMGLGGGYIGWGIVHFLVNVVGFAPLWAVVLLVIVGVISLKFIFRITREDGIRWLNGLSSWAKARQAQLQQPTDLSLDEEPFPTSFDEPEIETIYLSKPATASPITAVETTPSSAVNMAKSSPKKGRGSGKAKQGELWDDGLPEKPPPLVVPAHIAKKALATMPKAQLPLPNVDLLESRDKSKSDKKFVDQQAQIIEDTLLSFDIPAKVIEKEVGPTITQFGVKLGTLTRKSSDGKMVERRIRVRKVVALINDLALALSASPIRIEAPIPGRPLVGIEVPNRHKAFVTLGGILKDDGFKKREAPLMVALGRGISGEPVIASLMKMPHLLIAGATGSGKSVCLNTLISTLLCTHTPEQLRLLMVDPKMVELTGYNGIPHLVAPVVTDFEQVVGALSWATREMERRYKLFAQIGARSISSYNQKVDEQEKLPFLVVIIDELADLMMMAPDEVERHICRIAQMARATGIHLVIATQRPSTDVITGLIKANFPARIAFAVTSQIDSRVILDTPGAEKLLGQGDMLFMSPDSSKLLRLQGCYVSDKEIQGLVNFWKGNMASPTKAESTNGKLPWTDIMAEAEKDDMLEEAVKLVVDTQRASASFLQRRLGVGYPRASRLLDQLEEEGVVGPSEGGRPREVLWKKDKDEADYAEFEQDVAED